MCAFPWQPNTFTQCHLSRSLEKLNACPSAYSLQWYVVSVSGRCASLHAAIDLYAYTWYAGSWCLELVSPCKYAVVSAADFASALFKPAVQPGNLAKSLQVPGNYAGKVPRYCLSKERSRLCYADCLNKAASQLLPKNPLGSYYKTQMHIAETTHECWTQPPCETKMVGKRLNAISKWSHCK